jgi:hypothetical protein
MRIVTSSRRNIRRGATLVYLVLCMTAVLGVAAVALDGGILLAERRHAQATADAAALAAADDLLNHALSNSGVDSGTAVTSATTAATANGYTEANSTVTVRVYPNNYLGGTHAGTQVPAYYAEVTVTYNQARFFSSMWGSSSVPISARAVARGQWTASGPAILALDPTDSGTILTTGNGAIDVTGGGSIVDNSSSSSAITVNGKHAAVEDPGGVYTSGGSPGYSGSGTVSPAPTVNQPPTPDPLRFLPEPSQPANAASPTTSNGTTTYYPGYYPSGLSLSGNYGSVVFQPGTYYMNGPFSINGNPSTSVAGSGVMIFIDANASLKIAGNGSVALSPPTSGVYQNITFFQSRNNSSEVDITGNGSFSLSGTIYAPDATVSATGNGDTLASQIIAYQVQNKGAGNGGGINVVYDGTKVAKTRVLGLVE